MRAIALLPAALIALTAGGAGRAAPVPFAKPIRHDPSPEALLASLRAEGFLVCKVERGPEARTYVVTTPLEVVGPYDRTTLAYRTNTVRAVGPDVKEELCAFLKQQPRSVRKIPYLNRNRW